MSTFSRYPRFFLGNGRSIHFRMTRYPNGRRKLYGLQSLSVLCRPVRPVTLVLGRPRPVTFGTGQSLWVLGWPSHTFFTKLLRTWELESMLSFGPVVRSGYVLKMKLPKKLSRKNVWEMDLVFAPYICNEAPPDVGVGIYAIFSQRSAF